MKKNVTALLFLVTLICMSSTTVANEPENLLLNPGFEFGEEGVAYNWTHETTDTERINEQSLIGDWSMWMGDITTGYSGRETTSHSFEVSSGKEFKFGIYYYLDGVNGQDPEDYTLFGRIQWLDENKDWLGTSQSPSSGFSPKEFDEWEKDKHTITAHEDAEYGRLRITAKRDDADYEKTDVYWDNASIRMVGSKESYDITFKVLCMEDEYLEGAGVYVEGIGERETGERGEVTFEDMDPDVYNYEISKDGYEAIDGEVEIADGDVEEEVILEEKYEDEEEVERIEINSASSEELEEIVNIGPTIAEKISEDCNDFYALTQLTDVKGLGKSTVREIIEEGVAYVLPPENEEWKLSQNVCNGEDEGEENGMFIKDAPEEFEGQELEMEEIKEEVCPDKKVIEPEDEEEDEERFVLFDYDRKVYVGGTIESTVLVRNHNNYSEFRLYSYLYREHECLNQGCWTGNERNVEVKTDEKKIIHLKNKVKDDVEPGIYDFTVRIRNETDLEGSVEVTERESMEERKSKEVNRTEIPTGKTYKKRGPLESIIHSLLSLF